MLEKLPDNYVPLLPEVEAFLAQPVMPYIGGAYVAPYSEQTFGTYDPSSGRQLAQVGRAQKEDVNIAVKTAREAFDAGDWWLRMSPADRSKCIWRLAELIEQHAEVLAQLDSLDNGKPLKTTQTDDIPLSAKHLYYYAGWPTKIEGSTIPVSQHTMFNYTLREPVGVVGLIAPWNYPLLMATWKFAPALAAGNCIILKPAEQTPLSALYVAKLTEEAGFPPGVFNVLPGYGEEAGAALVEHRGVDKIGFTGSVEVARKIVQGSVGNLKRVSLELGGKSPNIVFADADLEQAIVGSTWAIFGNNGQSCTAGSRLYIERKVFDQVIAGMQEEVSRIKVGPGMARQQPDLGPVVSDEQLDRVMGYVHEALDQGAQAVTGGSRLFGELQDGYFLEPTLFTGVTDDLRVSREEIFGPVVCAMPFDDVNEIIDRANDTDFGLAAGLWTTDVRKAHNLARALKAGTIWINTWGNTEAASPFGGYKQSGYGREMGKEALDLYTDVKSVWIKTD
ncbi:MAG: aldehyde dehydrogenase family protein [Anaerolineaceae bacterium]|nr:aldehyde dehydrogenase family protein [Anaerolineaceae bacterium]